MAERGVDLLSAPLRIGEGKLMVTPEDDEPHVAVAVCEPGQMRDVHDPVPLTRDQEHRDVYLLHPPVARAIQDQLSQARRVGLPCVAHAVAGDGSGQVGADDLSQKGGQAPVLAHPAADHPRPERAPREQPLQRSELTESPASLNWAWIERRPEADDGPDAAGMSRREAEGDDAAQGVPRRPHTVR